MPQVQVALRALATGKAVRVNDVISYITVLPSAVPASTSEPSSDSKTPPTATEIDSSTPVAKRAFSPLDITKSAGALKPDIEWYLSKQIFPPIERLCAPIPGTDAGQLAECLGLDARKFASLGGSSGSSSSAWSIDFTPLDSQLPDSVRYKDCPRLILTCTKCKHAFTYEGIAAPESKDYMTSLGLHCPNPSGECGVRLKILSIVAQVEAQIRALTSRYYDGWLRCDEPTCDSRTRAISVYGHRCLGPQGLAKGCLGRMQPEVSGKVVGNTFGYWKGLFDVEKMYKGADSTEVERVRALRSIENREVCGTVKDVVEGYEKKCGWVWVQMDGLFGWAMK